MKKQEERQKKNKEEGWMKKEGKKERIRKKKTTADYATEKIFLVTLQLSSKKKAIDFFSFLLKRSS